MSVNSLKEKAYQTIKKKIVNCDYLPNTFLNENLLQNEIGMSRTPIRDAIGRLEQENLVRIIPKKGIVVSELTINEISSIYEVRMLVEPFAVEKYAETLDKALLLDFRKSFSAPCSADRSDQPYRVDDRMHHAFISATKNKYIIQTYQTIQVQNYRIRVLSANQNTARITESAKEHIRILDAVLSEHFEQAARLMETHLKNAKEAAFKRVISNGGWEFPVRPKE